LQRTRISVPYDGLLREKRVDVGQYVTPGTQLGVSFAVDTAEVRLPLAMDDLAFLDLPSATDNVDGDYPEVALSADFGGETRRWKASLIRTEGVLDVTSRVLYAVASVVDPYGLLGESQQDELRMGTYVRAQISGRRVEDVVVLPRFALRNDNTVLVANEDRELEIRTVAVAREEPRQVYITSGVRDGELVVTTTLDAPIPGTRLVLSGEEPSTAVAAADAEAISRDGETP
jgi:multidrug efflux pump subunit AcrA (membrane-fusion protein)